MRKLSKEKKRVLFVATVVKKHIMEFHIPYLKIFKEMGWETAVAAGNDYEDTADCQIPYCDRYYDIPFERNPLRIENIKAYLSLEKLVGSGNYSIVHCHTPVGGILTRLAARSMRKKGLKVIYTAHGFHFYTGAPLLNWVLYYPAEWLCSWWTDILITINKEDYRRAKRRLHAKKTEYVCGVGIDVSKFRNEQINIEEKRKSLHLQKGDIMMLSVGELSKRKNHEIVVRAMAGLQIPQLKYFICGTGSLKEYLISLINELGMQGQVFLLGYRNDIPELCQAADLYVFPSRQEGLPVALMEAMASGVPCIASRIRGNTDLIPDSRYLVRPDDAKEWGHLIKSMAGRIQKDGILSVKKEHYGIQKYDSAIINKQMRDIYQSAMERDEKL